MIDVHEECDVPFSGMKPQRERFGLKCTHADMLLEQFDKEVLRFRLSHQRTRNPEFLKVAPATKLPARRSYLNS
jgi:hypothetical protein